MVTQLVSTELMLTPTTDKQQKYLMRAMPIIFVFILLRFPSGLFVYWVTTNLWTVGQQLIIRRVMKPKDLATMAAQPVKRSRFMEAVLSAQNERSKSDEILEKRRQKAAELAAARGDKPDEVKPAGAQRAGGRQAGSKQGGRGAAAGRQRAGRQRAKPGSAAQEGCHPDTEEGCAQASSRQGQAQAGPAGQPGQEQERSGGRLTSRPPDLRHSNAERG